MRFIDFKRHFESFKVFSTQDILKWDSDFDTRRLVEWQEKGYVRKVINRWYVFADASLDENFLYLISNRIYSPSYISFESALAYYRLIPEGVYTITAATSLKPHQFVTSFGSFGYRHLRPELMFGYRLINLNGMSYKIAEPEKLILDYFYLNTNLKSANDFKSLRINQADFKTLVNIDRLLAYLQLFENKLMEKRIKLFLNTLLSKEDLSKVNQHA